MKQQPEEPPERQGRKNPKLAAERLAESTGFDDRGNVVGTTGFDELSTELAQLGIDAAAFQAAKSKKQLAMLRNTGVSKREAAELIGNYRERHRLPTGNPHQQQRRIEEWLKRKPEAEKWLRNVKGLPDPKCALVLACVFDGSDGKRPSLRRLESSTGRKRQWISNTLRQSTIRDCIAELRSALGSGKPLQLPESPALPDRVGGMWLTFPLSSAPRHGLELNLLVEGVRECRVGGTLSEEDDSRELKRTLATIESYQRPYFPTLAAEFATAFAQDLDGANPNDPTVEAGSAIIYPDRGKEIAEAIIVCIRKHPAVLLQPEGRILLEGLVDLLEAARFGCSKGRVRGLRSSGKPKEIEQFAQRFLVELTKAAHGAKRGRREGYLCWILCFMAERVGILQRECKAPKSKSAARVAQMREAHTAELESFTDKELQGYLTDPPTEVACRLAAKAANTTPDSMKRIQNSTEAKQATDNPFLSLAFGLPSHIRRIFQLVAGSPAR